MKFSNTRLAAVVTAALLTPLSSAAVLAPRDEPAAPCPVVSSYFAGYHANTKFHSPAFTVDEIPWSKYTDIKYAFAETTETGDLDLSGSNPELLSYFVEQAHHNGVKASVSIGGWTGSRYFSSNFGSKENRTNFVNKCLELVHNYNLDGLDIDYEYPNRQGLGCNAINVNDAANFLLFLQELRATEKGKTLLLTAAGSLAPWYDASGKPSKDLSGFAKVLDYITIMGYDVYGAWAQTAGPNTPLQMSCDSRNTQGGIVESASNWQSAGIPANKLTLGLGFYAHAFSVNTTSALPNGPQGGLNMYPPQNSSNRLRGSSWDTDPSTDECGQPQPPSGTWPIWSLVEQAKVLDTSLNWIHPDIYNYDKCSETPAIYIESSQTFISYDNVQSITAKVNWAKGAAFAGVTVFEAGGDYKNILLNQARKSLGLK